jgi:hypothetical protein
MRQRDLATKRHAFLFNLPIAMPVRSFFTSQAEGSSFHIPLDLGVLNLRHANVYVQNSAVVVQVLMY